MKPAEAIRWPATRRAAIFLSTARLRRYMQNGQTIARSGAHSVTTPDIPKLRMFTRMIAGLDTTQGVSTLIIVLTIHGLTGILKEALAVAMSGVSAEAV